MVMSSDGVNESDMMCVNAASAALMISDLPFHGPVGAVRIGRVNGELVVEPTHAQMEASDMNLVYVGTAERCMMIEGDARELPEAEMIKGMRLAHEAIQPIIRAQLELREKLGLGPKEIPEFERSNPDLLNRIMELKGPDLDRAMTIGDKKDRGEAVKEIRDALLDIFTGENPEFDEDEFFHAFDHAEVKVVRDNVLNHRKRVDGRAFDQMRPLDSDVGILPRCHGSSMFSRGETQSLATITLGTNSDTQALDSVTGGPAEKSFLLHYNFPPYSVGEAGRLGATSRREIGHGNLAERSLKPVMPEEFPYSVRLVSEIMSSNGSTSMASVCAGTLALMDAGIPISRPVAGISVGLFTGGDQSELVLDILGVEDHCGDMDFKVCGTREGITGFQVDMKIHGLNWEQIEGAFELARKGRLDILSHIEGTLSAPREEFSVHAPRIETVMIDPEKIGALIGPGGKNIRRITDSLGVQIDIEDDGKVFIFSTDGKAMKEALREVQSATMDAEAGQIYRGVVNTIKPFGAFVEILPGKDGLLHISEIANRRIEKVEDVLNIGDVVIVKCLDVDERGKVRLSMKDVPQDIDDDDG